MALLWLQASPADQLTSFSSQIYDYFKLLLVLAGVLLLAILTVRYWLPRLTGVTHAAAGPIRVVSRFALEPRKNLYILKVGDDSFLIGTSESEIFYLTSLDTQSLEPYLRPEEGGAAPRLDFGQILRGLRKPRE